MNITNHFMKLCAGVLLTLSCAACSDDTFDGRTVPPQTDGALSVPFEVDGNMPLTRGVAATDQETTLKHAYVLFFDAEDSDTFVGYLSVTVPSGKSTLSFDPPGNLQKDHDYRVLSLGNADSFCASGKYDEEKIAGFAGTYSEALGYFTVGYDKPVTSLAPGILPLWGEYVDEDNVEKLFRITTDGENKVVMASQGRFYFSRAICRIDIHNLVGQLLDIRYARVVNSRTEALAFSDGLNKGKISEFIPVSAPSGEGYMPITVDMVPGTNTTQRLESSLYAFPNVVNTSVVNDRETTSLLIAGYYIENGVKDTELTYYRFNLANLGESQVLRRNYCYRATIKGVRHRGASDEKTAFNASTPVFEYNVDEEWGTSDDNVVSDKDGNFLIVNKTHLTFKGDASEADFVELRVSTNPELQWEIRKVEETGNSNDRFDFEKISDQAVKCGPNSVNSSEYVLYGYYEIVATNSQTGKKLSMPIYLVQMSTKNNIKTLTVNGCTGRLEQPIDPYGSNEISLKVVTGNALNKWRAYDDDNDFDSWGEVGIKYTERGTDGTYFTLNVPANISDSPRQATLRFALDDPDNRDENGNKKVPDVYVTFTQESSPQKVKIINYPQHDQTLDLYCLSLEHANPNCVVESRQFQVILADPEKMAYRVKSDFDMDRDLQLSLHDCKPGKGHELKSIHPAGEPRTDQKIEGLLSGSAFWINPFRMGPGDHTLTRHITVEAYMKDDPSKNVVENGTMSFNVKLHATTGPGEPTPVVDDILMWEPQDEKWIYLPDRNYGVAPRYSKNTDETNRFDARWATNVPNILITETFMPADPSAYSGTAFYTDAHYTPSSGFYQYIPMFIDDNNHINKLYKDADKWTLLDENARKCMIERACVSKSRTFLVSDVKTADEQLVICWLPFMQGCTVFVSQEKTATWDGAGMGLEIFYDIMPSENVNRYMQCYVRPCRRITTKELEDYKRDYLGYK